MTKFRYYLTDDYGNVSGTNDIVAAKAAFLAGDTLVIDAHGGVTFEEPDAGDEPVLANIPELGAPNDAVR